MKQTATNIQSGKFKGIPIMKIIIEVKSIYGRETVYPACPVSQAFAEIAGTKTLSHSVLQTIERMGYLIELKPQAFKI